MLPWSSIKFACSPELIRAAAKCLSCGHTERLCLRCLCLISPASCAYSTRESVLGGYTVRFKGRNQSWRSHSKMAAVELIDDAVEKIPRDIRFCLLSSAIVAIASTFSGYDNALRGRDCVVYVIVSKKPRFSCRRNFRRSSAAQYLAVCKISSLFIARNGNILLCNYSERKLNTSRVCGEGREGWVLVYRILALA